MYMYVCMSACVYFLCMYVCIYVFTYDVCMYVYMYYNDFLDWMGKKCLAFNDLQ